jgi:AAA ATPase-like protein
MAPASVLPSSGTLLLEREAQVAALEALADGARSGGGRFVVIEGSAGIGKTRLLAEARAIAGAAGMGVLAARGGEFEDRPEEVTEPGALTEAGKVSLFRVPLDAHDALRRVLRAARDLVALATTATRNSWVVRHGPGSFPLRRRYLSISRRSQSTPRSPPIPKSAIPVMATAMPVPSMGQ